MDTVQPPPQQPLTTTTTTNVPQPYTYNDGTTVSQQQNHHYTSSSSSSPSPSSSSSVIIALIIISSAIIVTAIIYLLIRYVSRRCNTFNNNSNNDVVYENEHLRHHVISLSNSTNSNNENDVIDKLLLSLPLFTFSSLTGKIAAGDCAVCLSKFEGVDQLRLLPLCCHAFHAHCIDAWLKSNQTCPLCRSNVNPSDEDILNKISSADMNGVGGGGNRSNSFRIEIGSVSRRRDPSESERRSYSVGSYEYVIEDGYEIFVESMRTTDDKDSTAAEPPGRNLAAEVGSGRRNWLRDYVDRLSVSLSSRTQSFRGSGRFFAGSSRRSEAVDDFEANHGSTGEEISELFRWLSGV